MADVIVHADWGTSPRKRVACIARRSGDGTYVVEPSRRVGVTGSWSERFGIAGDSGTVLVGFDFPIGLPAAYASRAGITSFPDALVRFGEGDWADFYDVCARPDEVTLHRPFFPRSCPVAGMCRQAHLTDALGIAWDDLHRKCERKTGDRRAACPLFWTLGGNQVGKGALSGWREFVQPMRAEGAHVGLWPFEGSLRELLQTRRVVIAETYPTEFYGHLGLRLPGGKDGGKRSPAARAAVGPRMIEAAAEAGARLSDAARAEIEAGFGGRGDGEDAFDAMVGALGMIKHLRGAGVDAPLDADVRSVEGWILGQKPSL